MNYICQDLGQYDITRPARTRLSITPTSPLQHSIHHTMTDPIPSTLPAGPYVIRNRETSTVLHIPHPDAIDQGTISVQARQQDEGEFKDQQIWWIEPLAKHNTDPDKGTLYSITSPGSGKALEGNPDSGTAVLVMTWEMLTKLRR